MADVRAVKSGSWSDPTLWNTGALPTSADDVWSNNFTIAANTTTTVLSIRNTATTGITAGGSFTAVNGVTLTLAGSGARFAGSTVLTSSLVTGETFTIVGDVSPLGSSSNNTIGVNNTSSGILTIVGNIFGPTGSASNASSVNNASSGVVNITGSLTGGNTGGVGSSAVANSSTGTVNITGNGTAGTGTFSYAVLNSSSGAVNITGTLSASAAWALQNLGNGTVTHIGTAQASSAQAAIGSGSLSQVTILTGPLLSTDGSGGTAAASGVNPCVAVRWFPADTALSTFEYRMRGATVSGSPSTRPARQLFLKEAYDSLYPAAGNVRSGTTYGPAGINTGTCAVPPASAVGVGVPVDNTTGTAAIDGASIRSAVGLASANLDTQLAAIPTTAAPTVAAIRTELDANSTKLANLDATVSSRSTYAGADTSGTTTLLSRLTSGRAANLDNLSTAPPSAGDIATAVWAAASRTLTAAIDQSTTIAAAVWGYASGRTITGGSVDTLVNAPTVPSAAAIASQVRTELATELARLDAAISTRLASSSYTTPPTASAIAAAVNSALDRTGFSLTSAERQAIATAVEQSILNENDGQAILNAIVGAIGNQNIDQVALVAAIRADLERSGGTLATRSTLTAAQVRTELAPELSNLDATISSRLPSSGYTSPPSAASIASAVWSAATRTLTTAIDNSSTIATAVWSAVSRTITGGTVDTLTNAPSVPSAAAIASQVRTELSTELGRIDATVSSRLAPGGTLARVTLTDTVTTLTNAPDVPTEAEIADAVRTELTPELERMANCATVETTGDQIAALQ